MTAPKARSEHIQGMRPQPARGVPTGRGLYRGVTKSDLTVADWDDVKKIYRSTRAKHGKLLERLAE